LNRYRKGLQTKHKAIPNNCTQLEIKRFEYEQAVQAKIFELAKSIHSEEFSHEYDFILDDHVDYAARQRGINPMSDEYVATVAHKRAEAGVSPMGDDGMPVSDDTWKACLREAEAIVRGC
jgi:hypothetical protein